MFGNQRTPLTPCWGSDSFFDKPSPAQASSSTKIRKSGLEAQVPGRTSSRRAPFVHTQQGLFSNTQEGSPNRFENSQGNWEGVFFCFVVPGWFPLISWSVRVGVNRYLA